MPALIWCRASQQLNLITRMDSRMKVNKMTWMQGRCVTVTDCLLGKQHLYMTLGIVNICTVKAREFNPTSLPVSASFCSQRLSTQENRTIKNTQKTSFFSPQLVRVVVLWQLQSLNMFCAFAGRRGALYNTVTPRRHLNSRVFSEHAYLFSENSLHSLTRTGRQCPFLSSTTSILQKPFCLCTQDTLSRRGEKKRENEKAGLLLRNNNNKKEEDIVKS